MTSPKKTAQRGASIAAREAATRIVKKYGERDPARLCELMGIVLRHAPLGTHKDSCKGFYLYQSRVKIITVNESLDDVARRVVTAHELGHAVLHSPAAGSAAYHDFSVMNNASRLEREANEFAAECLIDDDVLREINASDFYTAAKALNVPCDLLAFKLRLMNKAGLMVAAPEIARSDFLLRME